MQGTYPVTDYYYEVALLSSPLEPLTYKSSGELDEGKLVEVPLQGRSKAQRGVIVKKVSKPGFRCRDILNITNYYYDKKMLESASFVSSYYVCSLGEALSVYTPFYKIEKTKETEDLESDIILSNEQQKGYDFLQQNRVSLLFANTGSGKTEIYIKNIEKNLV